LHLDLQLGSASPEFGAGRITALPNLVKIARIFVRADESYGWIPRSSRIFGAQAFATCLKGQGGFI
jgi:hypothetical protein